ncbi:hypothetical protein [Arthrobacter sp. 162MFSha1.1]|uniref:hypothetical protein n=1 Tax=Arthrobacter sp. 162MFSha1.1 TaxID=1151119 RepID=UPI0012DDED89|nr:hypothetical protein [Arthrobacter sp. 162MFSha1.1]
MDPMDPWAAVEDSQSRQRRDQARATLREFYGSDMWIALEAGYAVAERSEELAGITAGEAREAWEQRRDQAAAAYRAFPEIMSARILEGESPAALAAELNVIREAYNAVSNGTDPATKHALGRLRDGYRAALAEIRPMGGRLKLDADSRPEAVEAIQAGAHYFPAEWSKASNEGREIYANVSETGASWYVDRGAGDTAVLYRNVVTMDWPAGRVPEPNPYGDWVPTGEVNANGSIRYRSERWEVVQPGTKIPKAAAWEYEEWVHPVSGERYLRRPEKAARQVYKDTSGISVGYIGPALIEGAGRFEAVAIHEQAHRYESTVASIREMENEFLDARTRMADGTLEVAVQYGDEETGGGLVRPDHFACAYSGRLPYAHDGSTEILSTGVESLFGGQYGGQIGVQGYRTDLEMRAFVLGVLATASGRRGE